MKNIIIFILVIASIFFAPSQAFAAPGINHQTGYQGFLKDGSGIIVPNGDYDMVFSIYDVGGGGTPLWTGTYTAANGNPITINSGFFHVLLGSGAGNTMTIDFTQDEYYIGITVGADPEMVPRHRITAHPQAFNADLLDGLDSTTFLSLSLSSGNIFVGSDSNTATGVEMSGDAIIDSSGALTILDEAVDSNKILDSSIMDTDISDSAAIAWNKINKTGAKLSDLDAPDYTGNNGKTLVVNGTADGLEWVGLDTSVVPENTNLYYTTARFDSDFVTKSTDDLVEGIVNKYYSSTLFNTDLALNTTDNLAEGLNLYYTDARFDNSFTLKTTSDLVEATNLYYTDTRSRNALSVSNPLLYNTTTGQFSLSQATTATDGYLSALDWNTFNNKVGISRQILTGVGLSGGGDLSADRTLFLDINSLTEKTGVLMNDTLALYDPVLGEIRKITRSNFLQGLTSALTYQGTWNASTNSPELSNGTGASGQTYVVSVAGTRNLGSGNITFNAGDLVIHNGSIWQKAPSGSNVASVFGRTGAVSASNGDYTATQITNTASGAISSINVQSALNELDAEKLSSLNGLTANNQTFTVGTSGSDFNISSIVGTHTFNIPDASAINRGAVTIGAQTFAGDKTLSNALVVNGNTTLGDASSDALVFNASTVAIPNNLNFDSNTLFIDANNNRVGIGTAAPSNPFSVVANVADYAAQIFNSGVTYTRKGLLIKGGNNDGNYEVLRGESFDGSNAVELYMVNSDLAFRTGATPSERMRITSSGNVGIGTTSPGDKLHIEQGTTGDVALKIYNSGNYANETASLKLVTYGSANKTYSLSNNLRDGGLYADLFVKYGTSSLMSFMGDSGNVGIGTTSPTTKFHISSDSTYNAANQFMVSGATDGNKQMRIGYDTTGNYGFIRPIYSGISESNLVINPVGGNVGIGRAVSGAYSSPDTRLHITGNAIASTGDATVQEILKLTQPVYPGNSKGSAFSIGLSFYEAPASNYPRTRVDFKTTGRTTDNNSTPVTVMSLKDDGNVGIGTTTPSSKLHLAGSMKIDGTNTLEFGAGVSGKQVDAGKIGYQTFTVDALDIVGAGTSGTNRKIKFWNEGGASFNGNVGIGTTSPGTKLDVNGTAQLLAQGALRFADVDSSNYVAFQAPAALAANILWTLPSADGISEQVLSTSGNGALSWVTRSNGVTTLAVPAGSNANGGSISGTMLTLSLADDTNPGLVSTGTQSFAGDKTFNGEFTFNSSTVATPNNLNFDSNTLYIDATNNRVGIGTATPGASKLFVAAGNLEGIRVAGALDENLGIGLIRGTGDGASTTTYNGALESWFGIAFRSKLDGVVRHTFNTRTGDAYLAGNVGIGTASPADKLHVAGDVRVGTGITGCVKDSDGSVIAGTCSSDVRLKTGVVDMDSILNKFTGLRFVNYHWNDTAVNEYSYGTEAVQRGLIADEVEALFPELVHIDDKNYKTLDYSTLSLYGLKAIQELSEKVDVLMTAVSGYFKRIFANELCLTDSSGQLVCVTGENLRQIGGSTPLTTSGQVHIQNNEEATQSGDQTITTEETEAVPEITTPIPTNE